MHNLNRPAIGMKIFHVRKAHSAMTQTALLQECCDNMQRDRNLSGDDTDKKKKE